MCLNDFNGKKSKIALTLKGIDEVRSGLCKSDVFYNLLSCLEVELSESDKTEIAQKYQLTSQGVSLVKYQDVLKALRFDNHTEKWIFDDHAVVGRSRGLSARNFHSKPMRFSYESKNGKQLNAEELKKLAHRGKGTNTDFLNDAVAEMAIDDEGGLEATPSRSTRLRRTASAAARSVKSKPTSFTATLAK